ASLLGKPQSASLVPVKQTRRVAPGEVLEKVASYFDIRPTAMKGPKRDRPIARPRQIVMYLCKTELGLTLEDIGGLLGGRDHTTIMHGVETITRELSTSERMREDVSGIKQKLFIRI
ncbi:MAG TPA: helix-turn-helix domain-containing protein, partial [Candidatus Paceibacterota bacterium]